MNVAGNYLPLERALKESFHHRLNEAILGPPFMAWLLLLHKHVHYLYNTKSFGCESKLSLNFLK